MSEIHEAPIIHGTVSVSSLVTGSVIIGSSEFNAIDTELNSQSTNPVTNLVVKEALDGVVKPTSSAFSVKLVENQNSAHIGDITFSEVTHEINTFNAATTTVSNYSVTVASASGGNKYFIDGQQQPILKLTTGNTYVFDWSAASNHPFRFSTNSDGSHASGAQYSTGVTYDDVNHTTTITVTTSTPTLFHYYCGVHSGMGGQANTLSPRGSMNLTVTASGGKYFIDGQQQPTLELVEGNTYVFDWSAASDHPFRFSTTSDGTHVSGAEYTTGVNVDDVNKTSTIIVAASTPTLFYYCHVHSGMGGLVFTPFSTAQGATPYISNDKSTITTPTSGTYLVTSTTSAATQSNKLQMSLKVNDSTTKSSMSDGLLNMTSQLFLNSNDMIKLHSDNNTSSKSTFSVTLIKADQIH